MIWDVMCYIMGAVSIIGPICLIFWYTSAAKKRLKEFHNRPDN
jgi:hypothetical protein